MGKKSKRTKNIGTGCMSPTAPNEQWSMLPPFESAEQVDDLANCATKKLEDTHVDRGQRRVESVHAKG